MTEIHLPPAPLSTEEKDTRLWSMLCHLSALLGLTAIPLGNLLGPLLIWQIKKNELPGVDAHGKEALNFQLSMTLYLIIGGVVTAILIFFLVGFLFVPVLILLWIMAIVLTIIAAIKANDGKFYRYPLTIRFFS
jgi:uncharacterized protein